MCRITLATLALTCATWSVGCGDGVIRRADDPLSALPPATKTTGFLRVVCDPNDVDVYVDDAFRGRLDGYPEGVMALPRGFRRITLRKSGHLPMYAEVEIGARPVQIEQRLIPEPPDPEARSSEGDDDRPTFELDDLLNRGGP
ncbi:MAG: hypothetical protein ACE366_01615 [Bradymonadia bacterium]